MRPTEDLETSVQSTPIDRLQFDLTTCLRILVPRWWWISALVVVSQPLVWLHAVDDKMFYGALLPFLLLPLEIVLCCILAWTARAHGRRVMAWTACAAVTTACMWAGLLLYPLVLVFLAFAVVGLRPTPRRRWIVAGLGLACQGLCAAMLALSVPYDGEFLRGPADWIALAQALAVWVPAFFIARGHDADAELRIASDTPSRAVERP